MKKFAIIGLTLTILFLSGCAKKVSVDYGGGVDLSSYRTFSVKPGTPCWNPQTEQMVIAEMEGHLSRKGFTMVESDPDLYVTHHAIFDQQVQLNTVEFGYNYHNPSLDQGGGERGLTSQSESFLRGTLIVDVWDKDHKLLLWRATAEHAIGGQAPNREKKLKETLNVLFERFPPRSKAAHSAAPSL